MPFALALLLVLAGPGPDRPAPPPCDADNGGLTLPAGFCALVVAENLPGIRHLAVAPNGDLFVARQGRSGGVMALRDANGDGKAEVVETFFKGAGGSGLVLDGNALIFSTDDSVLRFPTRPGELTPAGPPVTIARNLPPGGHSAKGLALDGDYLFVSFGSLTNSCQEAAEDRRGPYPGVMPCPELPVRAGIWRFSASIPGQTPSDAAHWGTGMRNPMSMAVQPGTGTLYTVIHGRDQLAENWKWPAEDGRENPAEEFGPVPEGADYGWPYCFYNPRTHQKLLNPEYGGDGKQAGDCGRKAQPAVAFPAHWAPDDLLFYTGDRFGPAYRDGAFIAFHGSWNRAPAPQQGYRVVFVPFTDGKAAGTWQDFAVPATSPTAIRPTGLAQGPDGSLYLTADAQGKIWRIVKQ